MTTANLEEQGAGARPADWLHFDLVLGLGLDLLPVVSNTAAERSPDSKLRDLGKTPSRYNAARQVVGIAGWTGYAASDDELARWADEPDYGICIQTRAARALDIDVPDPDAARAITDFIALWLGDDLPTRYRANSGKVLLAFYMPGAFAKRKLVVDGGVIEFLATGQQFVAAGLHPSGARYEWRGGLPAALPELPVDQFEALWSALAAQFAVEPAAQGDALTPRQRGPSVAAPDPVADWLRGEGLVLGEDREGALQLACPWQQEHTTGEAGDGSTVWFPAGTNGYDRGHFKCLHGHCTGRGDGEFLEAVGYAETAAEEFDIVVASTSGAAEHERPRYQRDKCGKIEPSIENIVKGLSDPIECGMQIRYDEFRAEVVQAAPGTDGWRSFTDADYTRLRIMLERRGFKPIGREIIRDAVWLVADEASFDTAITWIDTLKHDGVPRIDTFMRDYLNAADTPYTRAVSRYMWTALAGRVLDPGCEAPMVPVLIGAQGARKTSSVAAISPARDFFLELKLDGRDEDASRMMRGKLVVELGELKGLRSRDAEAIKSFISRRSEEWVPKFKEFSTQLPRRFLFIGTSNPAEILDDDTGERRWLPTMVGECDPDAIARDRLQLWAEARDAFIVEGIAWQDAERLAPAVHAQHKIQDPWLPLIAEWLDTSDELGEAKDKPADREFLRACDVATGALRLDPRSLRRSEEMQIGKCLRALGYERASARVGQHVMKVWKRKT
ncbi:bifunctional DNA primase/polymerase [Burkholderia cenocepacia]|uniref:VapE domain-containing protein n=1 Tax=Burkholderia cenocepacia TaxID=95486 RepID=UPI002863548F|nr:VapE domain-containing protein [Burkholderia cenocepacia]MDR8026480.1 bifunctional DNA primase/polymerase [Burkholderia cenocepacia]MDR8043734.1 bifunctional DNA primase/polymerase [Burkholderia cenocepacia]